MSKEPEQSLMALHGDAGGPRGPSRRRVWEMFNRIAHRYDMLNHLLSMGRDVAWRKRMAVYLPPGQGLAVLDVATGTGDQLLELWSRSERLGSGVGVDMAEKMLARGREKITAHGLDSVLRLDTGDATKLPSPDGQFDVVTISFGIRNVSDVDAALGEIVRVLKPGGRALVLEFSLPRNRLFRALYLFYFRHILPRLGGFLSGDMSAYRYLNATVEFFPYGEAFCRMLESHGLEKVAAHPLTFGIATIYQGDKPSA